MSYAITFHIWEVRIMSSYVILFLKFYGKQIFMEKLDYLRDILEKRKENVHQ